MMIVRIGLLKQKPDWSEADFRKYWKTEHPKVAGRIPSLILYQQNHTIRTLEHDFGPPVGSEYIDGASYLWFESEDSLKKGVSGGLGPELVADENHFIDFLRLLSAEAETDLEPPAPRDFDGFKLFSLVRRNDELGEDEFRAWWRGAHSEAVLKLPGLKGYRRNIITARQSPRGTPCDHAQLPIDGVAEYWFASEEAMRTAYASEEGRALLTSAQDGIQSDAIFVVESFVVR